MTADKIPDDVKVLVVIHPKDISDAAHYAIDQFVLRGGKLIAFLDPLACSIARRRPIRWAWAPAARRLEKLLTAWGLKFETSKVVADLDFVGRTREGRQPAVLALTEKAVNSDDILTGDVDNLFLVFAGAFSGTPAEGLKETVLLKTSPNSQFVDPMIAQFGAEKMIKDFSPSKIEHPLAVRLTGKFKTAFPDGKPTAATPPAGEKPEEKKPEPPAAGETLKESKQDTSVVLVGDSDMIQDQIAVREMQNPFAAASAWSCRPMATSPLCRVRSNNSLATTISSPSAAAPRASASSPSSRKCRPKRKLLIRTKSRASKRAWPTLQTKLSELQRTKAESGGQKFILSPEQQQEIANFREKERDVKKQLKEERKKLRADIDSLENRIKWLNIALMPVLVTGAGIGLALIRHKRRAAR